MLATRVPRNRFTPLALLALVTALGFSGPASAGDWQWTITPYAWLTDVGVDATVNDRDLSGGEVDGADLLSKLDMTLQLHLEGQGGRHGVLFDLTYLDLGGDRVVSDLPGILPGTVELEGDFSTTIAEVGGIYNPRGDGTGFALLYGARIIDVDLEIDADFSSVLLDDRIYHSGGTLYDGMLGARWVGALSERWTLRLRGDVSSGGTELIWNALGGVGYSFGREGRYTALAGYRHMAAEFDEDDARAEVETEVTLSGAFVALAIRL